MLTIGDIMVVVVVALFCVAIFALTKALGGSE